MSASETVAMGREENKIRVSERIRTIVGLILILSVGFALRLADFDDPPLDFHGTRQLRSLILARDFYVRSLPDADPTLSALSRDLSALETYEPPILERVLASGYRMIGCEDWRLGRVFSALFWTVAGFFVWLCARRLGARAGAWAALAVMFFFPMSVVMSRSIQPDPWMCAWITASIWAGLRWRENGRRRDAILTALFGGTATLIKAFAGFFIAGILLGVFAARLREDGFRARAIETVGVGLAAVAPSLIYAAALTPGRSGDFLSFWVVSLSGMILDPGFYADWLAMLKGLITLPAIFLSGLSLLSAERGKALVIGGAWAGYLAYGLTVPYQITTHEYYSMMIYPLCAISLAPLFELLWKKYGEGSRLRRCAAAAICCAGAFYGGYVAVGRLRAADYRLEPASWRRAGEAVPADASLIGLTGDYGMRLNYYGWRRLALSWRTAGDERLFSAAGRGESDFEALFTALTAGQDYFFVSALNELAAQPELLERLEGYEIAAEGNGYILYDLRRVKEP